MSNQSLLSLYTEILGERSFIIEGGLFLLSEVSGEKIYSPTEWNFAHVLSKGRWPELKYNKLNIVIMTKAEHELFDNHTGIARQDPRFEWVFKLREYLKQQDHLRGPEKFRL